MTFISESNYFQIIFNINFNAIERFSINFYLESGSILKIEPIEFASKITILTLLILAMVKI